MAVFNPQPSSFRAYADGFINHNFLTIKRIVGSVVECLDCRNCDQNGCSSKPICGILLCPRERLFMTHFPCLAVLAGSLSQQKTINGVISQ